MELKNKLEELKMLIHNTHPEIITILETKLTHKAKTHKDHLKQKHPKYITSLPCAPTGVGRQQHTSIASFHKNKLNMSYIQHFVENTVFMPVVLFYFIVFINHTIKAGP